MRSIAIGYTYLYGKSICLMHKQALSTCQACMESLDCFWTIPLAKTVENPNHCLEFNALHCFPKSRAGKAGKSPLCVRRYSSIETAIGTTEDRFKIPAQATRVNGGVPRKADLLILSESPPSSTYLPEFTIKMRRQGRRPCHVPHPTKTTHRSWSPIGRSKGI